INTTLNLLVQPADCFVIKSKFAVDCLRVGRGNRRRFRLMSTTADIETIPRIDSLVELKRLANRLRIDIVKMIGAAGSGHPGGSLSEVELLSALYFRVLRHNPKDPSWPDRDRFILSKGHGCPA